MLGHIIESSKISSLVAIVWLEIRVSWIKSVICETWSFPSNLCWSKTVPYQSLSHLVTTKLSYHSFCIAVWIASTLSQCTWPSTTTSIPHVNCILRRIFEKNSRRETPATNPAIHNRRGAFCTMLNCFIYIGIYVKCCLKNVVVSFQLSNLYSLSSI